MAIQLFSSRQRVATVPSLVHYVVSTLFSAMISVQPQCNSELFDVFHRITHLLHFLVIIRSNHFCCWNIGQVIPERTTIREEKGTSERC